MSDIFRKMLEDQDRLCKFTSPSIDLEKILNPAGSALADLHATHRLFEDQEAHRKILADIYGGTSFSRLFDDLEKHRKLLEGPIAEARRIGLFDPHSDRSKTIMAATEARSIYERTFRLPERTEFGTLIEQARQASAIADTLIASLQSTNAMHSAMESMTQPWLHIEQASQSTAALAKIVAIGDRLSHVLPYEAKLVDSLRPILGDWRDPISFANDAMVHPIFRTEFYAEKGLDPTLTDFPVVTFHEGAVIGGLESSREEVDREFSTDDKEHDTDSARARKAFGQLRRFEVTVRAFIVAVMEEAFGEHWIKHKLPKDMRDKWNDNRKAEIDAGRSGRPLIEYADFSDYRMIIERADNWNTAFKPVFRRPEDIRESFQRLNPVRIATMHSRIVTLEDELLLMVETSRILKAIRSRSR